MATTYYNDIQKLYVAYFNRPADPAGLAYWETAMEGAKGNVTALAAVTATISAAFAASAEYKTTYANMTNAQIVSAIYQNLFGRPAESAGQTYWATLLDNKSTTIDKVAADISKGAQGTDLTAYNNKVAAAAAFSAAVDTDAEKAGYTGTAANQVGKSFLATITTDASLAAAITPTALNTTVANAVTAGTPFTVSGALKTMTAAMAAESAFLAAADGDNNAATSATDASLQASITAASTKIGASLTTAGATGTYTSGSAAVKAALVNDQQTINTNALTAAQATQTTANANVAKVAGLQDAINAVTTQTAVQTSAVATDKAATADLAAKQAAFQVTQGVVVTFKADGTATYGTTAAATQADLIVKNADGTLSLANNTNVTEAKMPGVTALLNSSSALESADAAVVKANLAVTTAQLNLNHLDVDANNGEAAALAAVAAKITTVTLASGQMPTEAQISTELATLQAKAAAGAAGSADALASFQSSVDSYHALSASNPTVAAQTSANASVTAATKTITDFNTAVAALTTANSTYAQYQGYDATTAAAQKVFADNGFVVTSLGTSTTQQIATASSDLYVAGTANTSIALFGLQGKDALYIGTDYTLNTGKLAAGVDTVKEVFMASVNNGADTQIILEKSAFGSHAATPEVVTITLTGVAIADVHLNNGIITVGSTVLS